MQARSPRLQAAPSDPLTEHGEDRRQDQEGEGAGGEHDDGAGHTHGVDEALGEDGQGGEGGGDGQ
jgi:hypothetical protein